MTVAEPLKKPLPSWAHFMLLVAHAVDMAKPKIPTDIQVTSALDRKCRVLVLDGIATALGSENEESYVCERVLSSRVG